MKISVVVPAFNEEKILARSLAAMREACSAFDAAGWAWEIVVCDNNSTDRTAEIARAAGAAVVFEPVNQIARARNAGGFAASGDWLVFVDADSFPTPALFRCVVQNIQQGDCLGGGCLVKLDERMPGAAILVELWNLVSRLCRWAAGSFIYCEARVFRELGGFSHKLFVAEEIEFSGRLKSLARTEKRKVRIISRERLTTSARKMHLYNKREHFRFMVRAVLQPGKIMVDRDACHPWYDGRR